MNPVQPVDDALNQPFTPPGWPAAVRLYQSSREHAGLGQPPYDCFNVALHVGDDPAQVLQHRLDLLQELAPAGVQRIDWLNQVHGTAVHRDTDPLQWPAWDADAAVTGQAGQALAIMTADCLPVVLCDAAGTAVACIHAGWRGLCAGVIEAAAARMAQPPARAWLGPCIGPAAFEVGEPVRAAFVAQDARAGMAFVPGRAGHHWANLPQLAAQRLEKLGISAIVNTAACTVQQPEFFSYRREGRTGRLVTLVWRVPEPGPAQ